MSVEIQDSGYKSLFSETVERLKKLGKSDAEILSIDDEFIFTKPVVGNFANDSNVPEQETVTNYYISQGKDESKANYIYISLLKQCYPMKYYGKYYEGSKWMQYEYAGIYDEKFLDKTKWKHVPTEEEFLPADVYTNKAYINNKTGNIKDSIITIKDNKYQQYLQDIWPEFWTGKIFDNRKEVNEKNIKNNQSHLCKYTYRQILGDMQYAPAELVMTDGHYKAIIMGVPVDEVMTPEFDATIWNIDLSLTELPVFLTNHAGELLRTPPIPQSMTEAEDAVQKIIDAYNESVNFEVGLPGLIKKSLKAAVDVIVINIVWNQVKDGIDKEALESGKGIDTKQMCKDALKNYLDAFKDNVDKMKKQAEQKVKEKIDEICNLAKGVWDNITSIPTTVSSMISTAALPQTIPTTGGIPNPVTVIMDVINIIDSILALFPPIINGILQILTIMKSFVIALPAILGPLKALLDSITAIMKSLKSKKDSTMSYKQIHKAIDKANKQIEKLKKKQQKLDKENDKEKAEWDDLEQTIKDLQDNIVKLEEICPVHSVIQQTATQTEFDFDTELASLNKIVSSIENISIIPDEDTSQLVINADFVIPSSTSGDGRSGNLPVFGQDNNSASIVSSPLQLTNITPYCGKVFANL